MKTENKIIKLMIETKRAFTIREIARNIKADYKIVHTACQSLHKKNAINKETIGKGSLCSLNKNYFDSEIYNVEKQRADELLRNANIRLLCKEILNKTDSSLFIFLIFGSYAKNKQSKTSDIDLMFIVPNCKKDKFDKKISQILRNIPFKTHYLMFSEEEFKNMLESKQLNVAKGAAENNVIIYGIENFYSLSKNA